MLSPTHGFCSKALNTSGYQRAHAINASAAVRSASSTPSAIQGNSRISAARARLFCSSHPPFSRPAIGLGGLGVLLGRGVNVGPGVRVGVGCSVAVRSGLGVNVGAGVYVGGGDVLVGVGSGVAVAIGVGGGATVAVAVAVGDGVSVGGDVAVGISGSGAVQAAAPEMIINAAAVNRTANISCVVMRTPHFESWWAGHDASAALLPTGHAPA